jgi:hypothetical protein
VRRAGVSSAAASHGRITVIDEKRRQQMGLGRRIAMAQRPG